MCSFFRMRAFPAGRLLPAVACILACSLCPVLAQSEVYSFRFGEGDDHWMGMSLRQKSSGKWEAAWQENPADSSWNGIRFSSSDLQEGDFLYIYKVFGGLQPTSLYEISFLSSFTLAGDTADAGRAVHLKMGANGLRPRHLYNRANFDKGSGPRSGRNLAYIGDLHWEKGEDACRYIANNYAEPVLAATNTEGNLYLVVGMEMGRGGGNIPPAYLNTLRIRFDYIGEDTIESKRVFHIDLTETPQKNVYAYQVYPEQEVVRYSVFTRSGHLVMVEEDSDCIPSCPNEIDASFLGPDSYLVEFILQNEKRIIRPLTVRP